jgi:hypothetical protein
MRVDSPLSKARSIQHACSCKSLFILFCFLKCSKTCLQHPRTCFIAESFVLSAENTRASRSTGEFVSRRSHCRDIPYQTERLISDVEGGVKITIKNKSALLTDKDPIRQR